MNWWAAAFVILFAINANNIYNGYQRSKAVKDWVGPSGYNWYSTAEEVSEGVDLKGKVALVTGANSGIGYETARVFALRGAHVVAVARTTAKAEAAIAEMKKQLPAGDYKFTPLACELSSLKSVDQAAKAFKALNLPLHYFIANAGIMALPQRTASADGYELQVAVNHLGHFHLVTQLMDVMIASKPARIVVVSSLAHNYATTPRAFLTSDNLEMAYNDWGTYGNSKLSNIIFAKELNERFKDKGVLSYSLHPGIIETNLDRNMNPTAMLNLVSDIHLIAPFKGRSIPQGAATQVYAALKAPAADAGKYLSRCNVQDVGKRYSQQNAGLVDDAAVRAKFWATSENLVKKALSA